jgi:hypothetical protein
VTPEETPLVRFGDNDMPSHAMRLNITRKPEIY